jgi:Nucleotidyl transferase AbiEii toxin, Type IV TA system
VKRFSPRLDVLPAAQRALWPELVRIPKGFVLYGGTALALRLGHRVSVDFDFFAHDSLDHRALDRDIPWLRESDALQEEANAKTVLVRSSNGDCTATPGCSPGACAIQGRRSSALENR